ncbi:hypothetical protein KBZ10_00175 [Streptomyces sp. F63]|uniref:DUF6234 family protein n=1 Tax=Streptomyces sp. F63 TaxID=2824887 RepID=UPI001B363B7F|nr:DUF6234 family protein [Streptomyces sp. F63]MBQ0982983.1 hypothetical protein [Streptomyces sp. F63]
MRSRDKPSIGRQAGVGVALLVIDLMVIAWLLFRYGMTGWADGYDPGNPPDAPGEALRGTWILAVGAVVTGGGLLFLRWRIPGTVQLVVLGAGAALLAFLSATE